MSEPNWKARTGAADRQPEPREAHELSGNPGQLADVEGLVEKIAEELFQQTEELFYAPSDPDAVRCAEIAAAVVSRLLAERSRERDEAQSAVTAWQEVYEGLEAHLQDRINMRDPASPETYLSILRSGVAGVERGSRQIVAARWAQSARERARAETAERRLEEVVGALEPFGDALGEDDDDYPDDMRVTVSFGAHTAYMVKVGDLRRARQALSDIQSGEGGVSVARGSGDDPGCVPAANLAHQPSTEGAVSQEGRS